MNKIKVLIVDDSALVRQFLTEMLTSDESIEVLGTAIDPIFAFAKIIKAQPDVITLDVEMPRMDGLTFLAKLMESYPIPVVMISSFTKKGCETTVKALELGAVDFIAKPQKNLYDNPDLLRMEIIRKVKNAAMANLKATTVNRPHRRPDQASKNVEPQVRRELPPPVFQDASRPHRIIIIGASTGGVTAVKSIITHIDISKAAVLLVLHMPSGFTASFANNLNNALPYTVKEAESGEIIRPGTIYVAPGGKNTLVEGCGPQLKLMIRPCDKGDIYKPSVDKAFISVARAAGKRTIAAILTGMGDDGARGMALLRQAGAYTIAQSEETSVIFGMPRRAIEMGGIDLIADLDEIPNAINNLI